MAMMRVESSSFVGPAGGGAGPRPKEHDDDELPALPAIDDDGSTFDDGDHALGLDHVEHLDDALDDTTAERDPIEGWVVDGITAEVLEGGALEESEPNESLAVGGDEDLAFGGEHGLLQDSDEPDGRDVSADEAGIAADRLETNDDGGAEGTGEDPALAITREHGPSIHDEPPDDDAIDERALEDAGDARARDGLEREPWPSRADVSWSVEPLPLPPARARSTPPPRLDGVREDAIMVSNAELVAVASPNQPLKISIDGGARWVRLASCASTTAMAALPKERGVGVIVALYDVVRDLSALVLVRCDTLPPVAELVADLAPPRPAGADALDDFDEWARVDVLSVTLDGATLDVVASGRFGALRARG